MNTAHELILIVGVLGLLSILAGVVSARFHAPLLLVFLLLGMLAGEDGPGGIVFNDFHTSYLVGSIALSVILFEGGMKLDRPMIDAAFRPALVLATAGVAVPKRVIAALELESGLNDPMAVFLTVLLVQAIVTPGGIGAGRALLML